MKMQTKKGIKKKENREHERGSTVCIATAEDRCRDGWWEANLTQKDKYVQRFNLFQKIICSTET